MMGIGILALLFLLPVLTGIAGVVLFIVGLVKKRAALWGSGIALSGISILMLVVGFGLAMFSAVSSVQRMARAPGGTTRPAVFQGLGAQDMFARFSGVKLPPGCDVVHSSSGSGTSGRRFALRARTPDTFDAFLASHFQPAGWDDVRGTFTHPDLLGKGIWSRADVTGKTCYRLAPPRAGGGVYVHIVYDPNRDLAWIAGGDSGPP